MSKKIDPSWERSKTDDVHSPAGIEQIKSTVKHGLTKLYTGINENQWRYEGLEAPIFADMIAMSRGTEPEKLLNNNGIGVMFRYGDQLHFLPYVDSGKGINQYGYPIQWHPMPAGWSEINHPDNDIFSEYSKMELTESNSVLWRNDYFGTGDKAMIDSMVSMLVDNVLTANQLQLLASMPFVFNVTSDNVLTAKNYFLSICQHKPAIFKNQLGDDIRPVIEKFDVKIDPSLFEIFDRFECSLLSYLGFPCIPVTKRAQQSVSEIQSNSEKVQVRRLEKLRMRQLACDAANRIWGTDLKVFSVIDEIREQQIQDAEAEQERAKEDSDDS